MKTQVSDRAALADMELSEPDTIGMDALLASVAAPDESRPVLPVVPSVVLGTIAGWDEATRPLVVYPGSPVEHPLPALTTVPLPDDAFGREAALQFLAGDPLRPLIVGLIQPPTPLPVTTTTTAKVDGQRVEFTAEQEIVLRCGKASITLTRAGKVLIEGAYVLTRSSGVNRIKGGSVQIN
jgi:hypothetical protein